MKEFVTAALPWVLVGIALAAMYRSKDTPEDENIDSIQQKENWEDE